MNRSIAMAVLLAVLSVSSHAVAEERPEWEYLVVSYGTTYFTNPLIDLEPENAARSKVMLFSDLGLTLPSEAFSLQRNMDVLGRFGWELVAVTGAIGGDQQLVFKRRFDAERSASEAERIKEQRDALIAEFVSAQTTRETDTPRRLLDLDQVERAQATEARNVRDAQVAEGIIDAAIGASPTLVLVAREAVGRASNPDADPEVGATVTIDVTDAAVVGPGQYRTSLVQGEMDRLRDALLENGLTGPQGAYSSSCTAGTSRITVRVTAVIHHDGSSTEVRSQSLVSSGYKPLCLPNPS